MNVGEGSFQKNNLRSHEVDQISEWCYIDCANCNSHLGWKYFSRYLMPKLFYGVTGNSICIDSVSNLQVVDQSAIELIQVLMSGRCLYQLNSTIPFCSSSHFNGSFYSSKIYPNRSSSIHVHFSLHSDMIYLFLNASISKEN